MNAILTASGELFDPFRPDPARILLVDIAHALSNLCRFTGHVGRFYSVAQHSVLVSRLCPDDHAMAGLLHDASEAYMADIAEPLKRHPAFRPYLEAERELMAAILGRFGLAPTLPAAVDEADRLALALEFRDLMALPMIPIDPAVSDAIPRIEPMPPERAKEAFIGRFYELVIGRR